MSYYIDIEHRGLAKFRRVRGSDPIVVQRKADEQVYAWEQQWKHKQELEAARKQRQSLLFDRSQKKALAAQQTDEAQSGLNELRHILARTMSAARMSWTSLFDNAAFSESPPSKPIYQQYPIAPKPGDAAFTPQFSLLSKIMPFLKRRPIKRAKDLYIAAHDGWKRDVDQITEENEKSFAKPSFTFRG
jgi:restriction system protein